MKKIISFDLDGTLADLNFEKAVWLEEIPKLFAKKNGLTIEEAKTAVFTAYRFIGDREAKWYDIKFWFNEFGLKDDYKKLLKRCSKLIKVYPDAVPALKKLRKKYKLIVISNAAREFIDFKLEVEGLEKYFDAIFSATTDFGCVKGDEKAYLKACRRMKIKPKEMIHIGDDYYFDYLAAKKANIDSYYLDRSGKFLGKDGKRLSIEKNRAVCDLLEFAKKTLE